MNSQKSTKQQKSMNRSSPGVVSLIALVLMATITATAVGSSAVIISELQQTESTDQSVMALYAAEAGVEDALFMVKHYRGQAETLADTKSALLDPAPRAVLPNATRWSRGAEVEERFIASRLGPDQVATLDVFNPDDPTGQSGIESLKVEWGDDCNGFSQLEITMFTWPASSSFAFDPSTQRVFKETWSCNITGRRCTTIVVNALGGTPGGNADINPGNVYRFIFRTLVPQGSAAQCSINNLVFTGYDVPNAPNDPSHIVDIPARIAVKSTGSFGKSLQALTASVPWRAPVSGLLNFVIFSEEAIQK